VPPREHRDDIGMDIDVNTALYAVFGDPVAHSLSPVMHNRAFSHVGFNGVYVAFQVKNVAGAVTGIKALGIKGASITIPHKVTIMPHLDHIDDGAAKIGAVNTVQNRDGVLYGFNSDGLGAVRALMDKTSIKDKTVWIIGAGGTARAIGFGIIDEGGRVTIINRTVKKGEQLAKDLGADFKPLSKNIRLNCQVLINTTSVGMTPHVDETPVSAPQMEEGMVVMDAVYNPIKTRLLREAEAAGCITIDGTNMFIYQGAFQFELWTGVAAPVEEMRQAVLESIARSAESREQSASRHRSGG